MAEMTLERAGTILANARNWQTNGDMTDVQLARKMETAQLNAGFAMAITSLTFMKFAISKDWMSAVPWVFGIGMIGFASYLILSASRFSKIRELFEKSGPQHLADLKSTSPDQS